MRIIKFIGVIILVALVMITIMGLAGYGAYLSNITLNMGNVLELDDTDSPEATPNSVSGSGVVYPLIVGPGEWLEYEIVSASNFQLLPGIAVQQGDKVRFEIVGSVMGKKMGLDMTTAVSFETPLCDVYLNGEKVGEQVGEVGTIAITIVYPIEELFWQDYQAVEANWNETTAAQGLPYHGEIQVESDMVSIEFGYTGPAMVEIQGRDGPVDVPIERGVTSITVDRGTGIVQEQTRDASGGQASYHIILLDSSAVGVR